MRIKIHNILFVLVLSIICALNAMVANAQEGSFPGTETNDLEVDKEKDKMMFSPGELDPSVRKTQLTNYKDSVVIKRAASSPKTHQPEPSKTPGKQPSQEDDSILSFNFLYYIFQKYKLQDTVD